MKIYPPAKINIGLSIVEKRSDGFHNIETVFYPIPLCDMLDIEIVKTAATRKIDFQCDGIELPDANLNDNLCCRAYRILDADYHLPPVHIRLHKSIPVGAGLGGGSSDAAYTLQALNDLFHLQISDEEMIGYASRLGSDCAFFLGRSPAFGTGKGDILEPIRLSLANYHILLVKPPVFVSTADAYSSVIPQKREIDLPVLLQAPVCEWRKTVFNDFEISVFGKYPEIGHIKDVLYHQGAIYAAMSGSGSSVYGIFNEDPCEIKKLFPGCFFWSS